MACSRLSAFALLALLGGGAPGRAQPGPQPPCGGDPAPPFAALDAAPRVKVWTAADLESDWKPPVCTGWSASESPTVLALAARFRFRGGIEELRRKIGAVSAAKGILYWSATQKQWKQLVLEAHASAGRENDRARPDFSANEIAEGKTLYFHQVDNLLGDVVYRMRIRSEAKDRLVFGVENAVPIKYLTITLFEPGQIQSICYLQQESADVWRYYSLGRTSGKAAALLPGHEASTINRAVALYRHLAGIPTGQEPPAAR
jgi:hypothetical protein